MNLATLVGARIPHAAAEIPSVLLLHGTGANGGTSFPDTSSYSASNVLSIASTYNSAPETLDTVGAPVSGQSSAIWTDDQGGGSGSAVINVATGSWLEICSETEWTLEFALYLNSLPTTFNVNYVIAKMTNPQSSSGSGGSWRLNYNGQVDRWDFGQTESGSRVTYGAFNASVPAPISIGFTAGRWMRVCLERYAGKLYYHLDGFVGAPAATPTIRQGVNITNVADTSSDPVRIGGQYYGIFANGVKAAYLSEIRLTKGYSRYRGQDYTPRSTQFPNV